MSLESNKTIVRRVIEEVYNQGNFDVADELIAPHYLSHNRDSHKVVGAEGVKQAARSQRASSPDMHTTIEDIIAEGDKVMLRARDRFTHQAEIMGYAPTGQQIEITWMQIVRVENDKLVESWWEMDMEHFHKLLSGE
jgi:predicted ester cyclase